jgi:hypothetical protein
MCIRLPWLFTVFIGSMRTCTMYIGSDHRLYRVAMATFWLTFHRDGKISPAWCGWEGGGSTSSPFHCIYYHKHSCGVRSRSRSYKKKMISPCSIWQGQWAAAQEKRCLNVHKRGNYCRVPRGFSVYSMNNTGARRRKMFITKANSASWLSSCWAPSQSLLKPLL